MPTATTRRRPRVLFLLKRFYDYGCYAGERRQQISNGLVSSARFVVEMLREEGWQVALDFAIDGNCIDRLVTEHRPDMVVLEALWVTPSKLAENMRLHPSVKWVVRVHSETPFLSQEGCAVEYILAYLRLGAEVGFNSERTAADFSSLTDNRQVSYLPNYYPKRNPHKHKHQPNWPELHVGLFGAIRPLKNQLIQAMAAVRFASLQRRPLTLHMNGSRIEQRGDNNLKNIAALMDASGYELVLHPWLEHHEFLELVATMDVCLQVSLSESFCLTAADAVNIEVPLVGSRAIHWLPRESCAQVDNVDSIVNRMYHAGSAVRDNLEGLLIYLRESRRVWNEWMESKAE